MQHPLSHYKFLSSNALALPTELLQVGFFRNNPLQNKDKIKHNLTQQYYKLENLYCDTFVETPLFSTMLVEHQNHYVDQTILPIGGAFSLNYGKNSKLLKQLKLKGNYTIKALEAKLNSFVEKFYNSDFYVNDQIITIFEELHLDAEQKTLYFRFSEGFIDYLNEREYSLTFIQNTDFVAIKRQTQIPLFLIIQSLKGLKNPFFTKRYIADILGITGDTNKKFSVAFKKLKEKHVLEYKKEVCSLPNAQVIFSRFKIKNINPNFVSKMKKNTPKKVLMKNSKAVPNNEIFSEEKQIQAVHTPPTFSDDMYRPEAIALKIKTLKQEQKSQMKQQASDDVKVNELEFYAFEIEFILKNYSDSISVYRCSNGSLAMDIKKNIPKDALILTPEIMRNAKIKPLTF